MSEDLSFSPAGPAALAPSTVDALMEAIAHRRSLGVARLLSEEVDPALIQRALEAADWAPSHGDTEPWRFVVYTGDGRRALGDAFAEAYRADTEAEGTFKKSFYESQRQRPLTTPVWISLGVEPALRADGTLKMTEEEEVLAVSGAVQNLHLVLAAQGLGGMWLSKGVFKHPHVAAFTGLTAPYSRLLGFFAAGWPHIEWPEGERRPLSEKVRWVTE
jgi:nitroreductase